MSGLIEHQTSLYPIWTRRALRLGLGSHIAPPTQTEAPSRRREDERASAVSPGKPGLTAWDHSDMSTTARP